MTANLVVPAKPRLATCALTGCFGCHMSLLDIDERILELADLVDLDVSPFDDKKTFDRPVDVGFVGSLDHLQQCLIALNLRLKRYQHCPKWRLFAFHGPLDDK